VCDDLSSALESLAANRIRQKRASELSGVNHAGAAGTSVAHAATSVQAVHKERAVSEQRAFTCSGLEQRLSAGARKRASSRTAWDLRFSWRLSSQALQA
jgi:hypothetical protein